MKKANPKTLEIIAAAIGILSIMVAAYFIFTTEGDAYRLTNWIISASFFFYIGYNVFSIRVFRKTIASLENKIVDLTFEIKGKEAEIEASAEALKKADVAITELEEEVEELNKKVNTLESEA